MSQQFSIRVVPPIRPRVAGNSGIGLPGTPTFFHSARIALAQLLHGLGQGSTQRQILVPAYVCDTVTAACAAAQFEVVPYRLDATLNPCIEDLEAKVGPNARALLLVHFFGLPGPTAEIATFCNRHDLTFIEDAAHVDLYALDRRSPIGRHGDYVVGSLRKFAAIYDGGVVVSAPDRTPVRAPTRLPRLGSELRALKHVVVTRGGHETAARPDPLQKSGDEDVDDGGAPAASGYVDRRFDFGAPRAMTLLSRALLRSCDKRHVVERRRAHFEWLHEAIAPLAHCKPLFDELPDHAAPYVFPLLLDNPERHFPLLRQSAVETLRWEGLLHGVCDVCDDYEQRLIQLPCHQELQRAALGDIVATLRTTIAT